MCSFTVCNVQFSVCILTGFARASCESLITTDEMWPLVEASGQTEATDAIWHLLDTYDTHEPLLKNVLLRLCAYYLVGPHGPIDPVARFHLTNGASVHTIHWAANQSERARRESAGMMVTYAYAGDERVCEYNRAQLVENKSVAASVMVRAMMMQPVSRL